MISIYTIVRRHCCLSSFRNFIYILWNTLFFAAQFCMPREVISLVYFIFSAEKYIHIFHPCIFMCNFSTCQNGLKWSEFFATMFHVTNLQFHQTMYYIWNTLNSSRFYDFWSSKHRRYTHPNTDNFVIINSNFLVLTVTMSFITRARMKWKKKAAINDIQIDCKIPKNQVCML